MKTTKILVILGFFLALGLATQVANADFIFGKPQNLGPVVNSSSGDAGTNVSPDGLELYFSSNRLGGLGGWDLYVSTRKSINDRWGPPGNVGAPVNSEYDESYPSLSSDGLTLYFSDPYSAKLRPGVLGGADIWMTTRASRSDPWMTPVNVGAPINSSSMDISPTISGDGLILVFASNRAGGKGSYDLWISTRATIQDDWGPPVNLGASVNSSAWAAECSLSSDGLAVFFCSSGPGSWDILMTSRKSRDEPWGQAVNLGPLVNSTAADGSTGISPDMRTLYFCSDRPGSFGSYDLYEAPIIPIVDFNGDRMVDLKDFSKLAQYWGRDESSVDIGPGPWGDGTVDVRDVAVLAGYWLKEIGLIAYWKLDETEGAIAHDSVGGKDGTLNGNPVWQPQSGRVAGALQLDGVDDCVSTSFILDPSAVGGFSVFAWVKGGGRPAQVIISQQNGLNWLGTDPFNFGWLITDLKAPIGAGLFSQKVITDGEWHRVGLTWDGSNRKLYVDAVEVAKDTQAELVGSDGGLHLGAGKGLEPGSFWSGLIDDVRVYDRAITP
jgi:Tol biopolymer transport system component